MKIADLLLSVAAACLVASPALATFELVPSRQPVQSPLPPAAAPPGPASAPPTPLMPHPGSGAPGAGPPPANGPAKGIEGAVVRGAGHDLPLRDVLAQIVPPALTVAPLAPDMAQTRLSFSGNGRPWQEVLSAALAGVGLVARQDGLTLTIARVSPSPVPPAPSASATAAGGPAAAPPAAAPTPSAPIWRLERGASVRETIGRWAAVAGYRIAPDDPDHPDPTDWTITGPDTIQADFATAVERLCQGFAEVHSPPRVIIYTNKTIRILAQ